MRTLFWVATVIFFSVISFGAGIIFGMAGGEYADQVDMCFDASSGKYIQDAKARKLFCNSIGLTQD